MFLITFFTSEAALKNFMNDKIAVSYINEQKTDDVSNNNLVTSLKQRALKRRQLKNSQELFFQLELLSRTF